MWCTGIYVGTGGLGAAVVWGTVLELCVRSILVSEGKCNSALSERIYAKSKIVPQIRQGLKVVSKAMSSSKFFFMIVLSQEQKAP